jgi:hypothetical protein
MTGVHLAKPDQLVAGRAQLLIAVLPIRLEREQGEADAGGNQLGRQLRGLFVGAAGRREIAVRAFEVALEDREERILGAACAGRR